MDDTWKSRDYPLLDAIVKHFDSGDALLKDTDITQLEAVPEGNVAPALRALKGEDPPLFRYGSDLTRPGQPSSTNYNIITGVTGHARRAVGAWPSELKPPRSGKTG